MTSHNTAQEIYAQHDFGGNVLTDPGSGGTLDLQGKSGAVVIIAGNINLPAAPAGVMVFVMNSTAGAPTVTSASQATTIGAFDARLFISGGPGFSDYWFATPDMEY